VNADLREFMKISVAIYERGAVNFFCMDLAMRSQTQGKKGFADALRYLMSDYVEKGKGFGEDELPTIFEKATGAKLAEFYDSYINGRKLPDVDAFLAPYGWKVNRTAKGAPARGGFHDLDGSPTPEQTKLREAFFSLPDSK
jgi:predicted metalloprotease with PDZ domain